MGCNLFPTQQVKFTVDRQVLIRNLGQLITYHISLEFGFAVHTVNGHVISD